MFRQLVLFTLLTLTVAALAGQPDFRDEIVPGTAVFKLKAEYAPQARLNAIQPTAMGIAPLDAALASFGEVTFERSYPGVRPPRPGGVDLTRTYNIHFDRDIPVNQVIAALQRSGCVEYAEPRQIFRFFYESNDPDRDEQYFLDLIQADEAHDLTRGSNEVAVAIVDMGMDMDHEDLQANLRLNPGEDLNHNGVLDEDDHNNRDDDQNGHRDDFYGWDFVSDDNNPDDPGGGEAAGHGTHTAGIASAVTDNETGIASVGFSCGIIPIRAGTSEGGVQYGVEGIIYAVGVGARVISLSWGRWDDEQLHDAVDFAEEEDVVVVAAAGNLGMNFPIYPAAYDNVVAVAATDRNDRIWQQSSYGNWVNISAPGVDIYSTYLNNGYFTASGTSMAAPLVAGTAVLLRSAFPALTAGEIVDLLYEGADNIDQQNPNYRGMLGAGRVNAYRSLLAGPPMTAITLEGFAVFRDDNDNERIDPGERAELVVALRNSEDGEALEQVNVSLSSNFPLLEVISGEAAWEGDIAPGEVLDNLDEPFVVELPQNAYGTTIQFYLDVTVQPGDGEFRFSVEQVVGQPEILLVADQGSGGVAGLELALDQVELGWERLAIDPENLPEPGYLRAHRMTVWNCGNAAEPLDRAERDLLEGAIQDGARVLLTGNRIGEQVGAAGLLEGYFGAVHQHDYVIAVKVWGLPGGRPIAHEATLFLVTDDVDNGAAESASTSLIRSGGDSLLVYVNSRGIVAGLAATCLDDAEADIRTAYMGFRFEAALDIETTRGEILAQLFDWFIGESASPIEGKTQPDGFAIEGVYPNPFNSMVKVDYNLPLPGGYKLSVLDLNGRQAAVLIDGVSPAGLGTVVWETGEAAAGVYVLRLEAADGAVQIRKAVLVK